MKTVVQRVSRAEVRVEGEVVGRVERGVLLLVGVERGDTEADALATARKIAGLRIFPGRPPEAPDAEGVQRRDRPPRMDLDLAETKGGCLVISQFTLAGTIRKGRRPGFDAAEAPALAEALYLRVAQELRAQGLPVQTGRFGAHMEVELCNDGPVTLLVFTRDGAVL
ncbi:D-aminoacyl-tRNA deacylase [Paraliomyxa miuraensis]|uniref:D-aminoacyl-tRNA deacylase n=1 Tax=Paraliomyxa miuraensis TaxID=376150 RepID=UPI002251B1A2|nr:D-aminoacyl-tRNA deacylase [Paraliomyxa miuraensis]MCX4244477.1 D-aminoacyl-tRNA deacylase [Paraliomyxa miuraensis]